MGVLVDDLGNSYSTRVVQALHRQAVRRDVSLMLFAGGQLGVDTLRNDAFAAASTESIDALLVMSVAREYTAEHLGALVERFRPLPTCTIGLRCPGFPCVQVDNEPAMRAALDHLVRHHGRRRILFLRGPTGNTEANQRFSIYRDVLRRQEIRFDPALVIQGDFHENSAEQSVTDHIRTRGTDFDAVMAANDAMALGALRALERAGARVPDSVALVGFDDVAAAWSTSTPLTTVRQPFDELASTALGVVLGEKGEHPASRLYTVSGTLVTRRSCGCVSEAIADAGAPMKRGPVSRERALAAATTLTRGWLERIGASDEGASLLVGAFVASEQDAQTRAFSATERLAVEISRLGQPVRVLQELLTEVRAELLPAFADDPARVDFVERIFHQARVLVANAAERQAAFEAQEAERRSAALVGAARSLLTNFDLVALRRAIRTELPRLGVPACSLLLYEHAEENLEEMDEPGVVDTGGLIEAPKYSQCVLAYSPGRAGSVPPAGEHIETRRLWPYPRTGRTTQTVQSLFFENERIGLLVLDLPVGHNPLHQALGEMISAALHGARLAQRLAEEAAQRERVERERLQQELEIAARIQSSILPRNVTVEGLELVAAMQPATEVGGDYYDVLPFEGGAWIGIGDVAGHGLRPGLVMVMLQSVVAAVAALSAETRPRDLIHVVNQVLYDNVRKRLHQNEHATLSVIRYQRDGSLSFAGAHEDLIIWRAAAKKCELIPTDGTWVAATQDIDAVTHDQQAQLEDGDVLVLYTDGAIEARDSAGEPFGIDRLVGLVEATGELPVEQMRDHIFSVLDEYAAERDDDIAIVVARHRR